MLRFHSIFMSIKEDCKRAIVYSSSLPIGDYLAAPISDSVALILTTDYAVKQGNGFSLGLWRVVWLLRAHALSLLVLISPVII